MRTDIPSMNPGKAMAQASHSSNAFVHRVLKNRELPDELAHQSKSWGEQTKQGFGTVLVLGCEMNDIKSVRSYCEGMQPEDILFDEVVDPTYPYIVNGEIKDLISGPTHTNIPHELESGDFVCFREEITCAYLFADKEDLITKDLIGHLNLHK